MGNFYFVQPDGGIGNKVITFGFDSILHLGNNGFILYGKDKGSGEDGIKKLKIFYDVSSDKYSWINTYKVNEQKYIRARRGSNLILPKGDAHELLENKVNEEHLFANINDYINSANSSLPPNLQLKLEL